MRDGSLFRERCKLWQLFLYSSVLAYFSQGFLGSLPVGDLLPMPAVLLATSLVLAVANRGFSFVKQVPKALVIAAAMAMVGMFLSASSVGASDAGSRAVQIALGLALAGLAQEDVRLAGVSRGLVPAMALGLFLTGVAAILQISGNQPTWSIYMAGSAARSVGLEETPVAFAYSVVGPIVLILGVGTATASSGRMMKTWLLAVLVGAAGLVASGSRSGVLAVGVGLVILLAGRRTLLAMTGVCFVTGVLVGVVGTGAFTGNLFGKGAIGADTRLGATPIAYSAVVITHPLGVPPDVRPGDALARSSEALGTTRFRSSDPGTAIAPHNAPLTVAYTFGWLPAAALLVIWVSPSRSAVQLWRDRGLSLGDRRMMLAFGAAMAAMIVHGLFHNASPILGEVRGWLIPGIIAGYTKTAVMAANLRHS